MKPTSPGARPVRRAGTAALLGAAGMLLAACSQAPAAGGGGPTPEPRPAEARPPTRAPVTIRLGVVVPQGGSAYLRQYADAVLEGVRVAAAERDALGRQRVELVIREASTAAAAAAAVREVSALGVIGIVGPLLEENVAAAANARPDTNLVIVSPTAAQSFARLPNVFALNVPDTLGARVLGEYAARTVAGPVAVLRPRTGAAQMQARAFSAGFTARAGRAPLEVAYDPGTTNYSPVLSRLRDARVQAFFVAAEEDDLRQLLPQVDYYGLGSVQVLATGPWATPDGLQRIGLRSLERVITTLPFLQADSAGTWQHFVRGYEALHRRSLDNPIPALGYDAAALLLAADLDDADRTGVARRLRTGGEVTGATGHLIPLRGSVGRRPLVVRVSGGSLVPLTTAAR